MKNKRTAYLALSLVMIIVLTLVPAPYLAESAKVKLPGVVQENIEIPEDAIYISTEADLLALAENCRLDTWSLGKVVVLNQDIVLSSGDFQGIPTFGGTFLGQGHSIKGLCLTAENSVVGFFRYLQKSAAVLDLALEGEIIPEGSKSTVGAFAGENAGLLYNVSFHGTLAGSSIVGGIAGKNSDTGIIYQALAGGNISGTHFVGGIAGENHGVIGNALNEAMINTEAVQNDITVEDITADNLFNTELTASATDIGGIAGISKGIIQDSANKGSIGYKNMGNNVGGIAGTQNGYVKDCVNYGEINGRKEVGGIVGLMEPSMVLDYDSDSIQILASQLDTLEEQLNHMGDGFEEEDKNFWKEVETLQKKMEETAGQMGKIVDTVNTFENNLGVSVKDISGEDKPIDMIGKVTDSANYGAVKGNISVGGIAGAIAKERDLDEYEDTEVIGETSLNVSHETRAVIRTCTNYGQIYGSKEKIGGIVGEMLMGAVIESTNFGGLDALNADYVGGIAGDSQAIIRRSNSRCAIAGADYVGGIAGRGYEVKNSYVFSEILAYTEKGGAILGYGEKGLEEEALIVNNRYIVTAEDIGGIDCISYTGAAESMTLAEFLELKTIPEGFDTVTITFKTEGRNDVKIYLPVGESLPMEQVPVLSTELAKEYGWIKVPPVTSEVLAMGETAIQDYLSETDLTNIYFDKTFEATLDTKSTVVKAADVSGDNRPVLLADGIFARDTLLQMTDRLAAEPEADGKKAKVHYTVTLSNTGVEKLHYLIPETIDTEKILVLVKNQEGIWTERAFVAESSYLVFDFTEGDTAFALVGDTMAIVTEAAGWIFLAAVGALGIGLAQKFIKRKKKKN